MIIIPSTEVASGSPLRSRISPRVAGRTTSSMPSAAAIAAYPPGSTPWSCTSRAPKTDSTIAISTKPIRRRSFGAPRRLPRGRRAGPRVACGRSPGCVLCRSRCPSRPSSAPAAATGAARVAGPAAAAVAASRPRAARVGHDPGHDRRRRQHRRLGRRSRLQAERAVGHGGRRGADDLAVGEPQERRARLRAPCRGGGPAPRRAAGRGGRRARAGESARGRRGWSPGPRARRPRTTPAASRC